MQDIRERVIRIVIENMSEELDVSINDETELIEDLNYDSVGLINLIVELEHSFDIEFNDADMLIEKMNDFGTLWRMVEELCINVTL